MKRKIKMKSKLRNQHQILSTITPKKLRQIQIIIRKRKIQQILIQRI